MFGKTIVFVVALCLIQSIHGDSIADLIRELTPKLKEAGVKVAKVTVEGGISVKNSFESIQKELNVLDKQLIKDRVDLFKIVLRAKIDAKEAGKDISACVQQVRDSAKDLSGWQFEKCRVSQELADLTVEIAKVAKLEGGLIGAPIKCVLQNGTDLDKIKQCILDIIDNAGKQADDLEPKIDPAAAEAEKNAKQCGNDRAGELSSLIEKVTGDFNDCVSKV